MAVALMKAETLPKAVTGTQAIQSQTLLPMLKVDIITIKTPGFLVGTLEIMATLILILPCCRLTARQKAHAHRRPHQTFWGI